MYNVVSLYSISLYLTLSPPDLSIYIHRYRHTLSEWTRRHSFHIGHLHERIGQWPLCTCFCCQMKTITSIWFFFTFIFFDIFSFIKKITNTSTLKKNSCFYTSLLSHLYRAYTDRSVCLSDIHVPQESTFATKNVSLRLNPTLIDPYR